MVPGEGERKSKKHRSKMDAGFVRMRCPNCDLAVQGAPERFQDTLKCPNCEQEGIFLRITEPRGMLTPDKVIKHIKEIMPVDKSRYNAREKHNPIESIIAQKEKSLLVRMKCSSCGAIVRSTPGKADSKAHCPNCKNETIFHQVSEGEEDILPFVVGAGRLHRAEAYSIPWSYVAASFFVGILLASIYLYFNPMGVVTLTKSHPEVKKLAQILEVKLPEKRRIHLHNYLKELPALKEMYPLRSEALAALNKINEDLLVENLIRQKEDLEKHSLLYVENEALKASLSSDEKGFLALKEQYDQQALKNKSLADGLAAEQQNNKDLSAKLASLTNTANADREELLSLKHQFKNFRNAKKNPNPIAADTLQNISTKTSSALMAIRVKNLDREMHRGFGCLVVVQGKEMILTGANLIRYATEIIATDINDREHLVSGAYLVDEAKGLALLSLPESTETGHGLQLGETPPSLGDTVITPGALEGKTYLPRLGFILQLRRLQTGWVQNCLAVQTDLALSPNSEGSPLLNIAGEIVGVRVLLNSQEQAQNFIVDLSNIKNYEFSDSPIPFMEIETTKIEAARRERVNSEMNRRNENIQMYYKRDYKMSNVGLMLQVVDIQKEDGDYVFKMTLQVVNPGLSPIDGGELYLVGFDTYTRRKVWSKLATQDFKGEGWTKEDILLEGFKVEDVALKRMTWNIIQGQSKLELFIGRE